MTWRRILFLIVLAPAAAVASATALASLARATSWPGWSSWLLPISIDVLAAFAVLEWASPKSPTVARSYARALALAALAVSVLGNAVSHLVSAGLVRPGWVLIVLVGAIPPAALGTAVHLAVLASSPVPSRRTARRPAAETVPTPVAQDEPEPAEGLAESSRQLHSVPDGDDVARVRQLDAAHIAEHGRPISRDKIRAELKCGNKKAGELLQAARAA